MTQEPLPLPGNRDENWRYAALRGVAKTDWSRRPPAPDADVLARIEAALPKRIPGSLRLVLFAGQLLPQFSDQDAAANIAALEIDVLTASATQPEGSPAAPIDQRFAAINRLHAAEVLQISIAKSSRRIALDILCYNSALSQPAVEILLQDDAQAEVTERQLGLDETSAVTNLRLDVRLGRRARLELIRLSQAGGQTHHLETLNVQLNDHAHLQSTQITLGGISTRATVFIEHGSGSTVNWNATALAEGQQVHDSYVRTAHVSEGACTRQLFRGIANGRGRIAFNGHMHVSENALRSDLQQSLKCLLDGTTAEADLRPQLEIYTDAVTASHGATVGKLDRDMMFYLLSRGIDPQTAESLLKWAFISDVLVSLPAGLRHDMELALAHRLPGAAAASAAVVIP